MTLRSSDLDWPLKKPCSLLCVIVEWSDYGPNLLGGFEGALTAMRAGLAPHRRNCWARSFCSFSNCQMPSSFSQVRRCALTSFLIGASETLVLCHDDL